MTEHTEDLLSQMLSTDVVVLLAVAVIIIGLVLVACMLIAWRLLNAQTKLSAGVMQMAESLTKKVEADAEQTVVLRDLAALYKEQAAATRHAGNEAQAAHVAIESQAQQLTGLNAKIDQLGATQQRLIAVIKPIALTLRGLDGQINDFRAIGGTVTRAADQIHQHVEEIKQLLIDAAKQTDD